MTEFHEDPPKVYVERHITVPGTLVTTEEVLKHRTKTKKFVPTKFEIKLMQFGEGTEPEVQQVMLVDAAGNQAFYGVDWEQSAPQWLHRFIRSQLTRNWKSGGLRQPQMITKALVENSEEVEAQRQALALTRDDPFVSPRRVKCAYDRCGNVLQASGDEHPWVAARKQGWKLTWGLSDPTGTDLWCALDHDSNGNPIHKD